MLLDLSYFVVNQQQVLSLSNENTLKEFLAWIPNHGINVRMPWGDWVVDLEGYMTEDEDFELQEEVFSDCSLEIQNLIYQLKKLQLKEQPNSKASLAFSNM